MSSNFEWEDLIWIVKYEGPSFLGWCVAIYFCLTRRRDNPQGAVYLGLAVLISFTISVFGYGLFYFEELLMPGFLSYDIFEYLCIGFHAAASIGFWVLLIMAVFARPSHYDYSDMRAFDDEIVR